jgi:hypothetical protein
MQDERTFYQDKLVGVAEIAKLARVSKPAVNQWRDRHADFPEPVAELEMGPVFLMDEVEVWVKAHQKKVVASHMRVFEDGVEVKRG